MQQHFQRKFLLQAFVFGYVFVGLFVSSYVVASMSLSGVGRNGMVDDDLKERE